MSKKIRNIEEIEKICQDLKSDGKTIVTTNGSFDILHSAHVNLLEKAKNEGDILIVLINSDDSIKNLKGDKRPIFPQNERAKILSALECVDYVVIFNGDNPLSHLAKIKGNIHVKGGSHIEERISEEKKLVSSWNGDYKTFELEEGLSTSNKIDLILKRYSA